MKEKLKPCPRCGNMRTILVSNERGCYQVRCSNCGFCKEGAYYYPKKLAIAVWNDLQEAQS